MQISWSWSNNAAWYSASSKHKIDTSSCSPLHYLTLLYFISLSPCSSLKPAFCLSLPPLHLTVQSLLEASSIVNIVLLECTTLPLLRSFVMTFRELQTHHPSFLSVELWLLNDPWEEILSLQWKFQQQQSYLFLTIEQIYICFSELSPAKMKTLLLLKLFLILSSICLAERIQVNNFFVCI